MEMRGEKWSEEQGTASPCCRSGQPGLCLVLCQLRSTHGLWPYSLSGQSALQSKPSIPSRLPRFPRTVLSIASANFFIPSKSSSSSSPLPNPAALAVPPTFEEIPRLACSASSRADPRSPSIVRSVSFSLGCSPRIVRIADDVALF